MTICLSSKLLGGCTNATAAETWSGWHAFTVNASRTACKTYPNLLDSSVKLMLTPSVAGVSLGNMSTIVLEIQPGGARASEASYTLNASVTPIRQMEDQGTHWAPQVRTLTPSFYLVLRPESTTPSKSIWCPSDSAICP